MRFARLQTLPALALAFVSFSGIAVAGRNGGSPQSAGNSHECEMIKTIIEENHLAPAGLYAVRDYNPGGTIGDYRMVNAALERHFHPSRLDEAFKRLFHTTPSRTPRFTCDAPVAFVGETKATKIVSRNRYGPDDCAVPSVPAEKDPRGLAIPRRARRGHRWKLPGPGRRIRAIDSAKSRKSAASGHAGIGSATGFRSRSLISQGGFRLQSCVQTEGVGS